MANEATTTNRQNKEETMTETKTTTPNQIRRGSLADMERAERLGDRDDFPPVPEYTQEALVRGAAMQYIAPDLPRGLWRLEESWFNDDAGSAMLRLVKTDDEREVAFASVYYHLNIHGTVILDGAEYWYTQR